MNQDFKKGFTVTATITNDRIRSLFFILTNFEAKDKLNQNEFGLSFFFICQLRYLCLDILNKD